MTPLLKKMQYKDQTVGLIIGAPVELKSELATWESIMSIHQSPEELCDFYMAFVTTLQQVEQSAKMIAEFASDDALIWLCYPKASSKKYVCEFNRDTGWESVGALGLEPVRQIAIDENWSGLRFRPVSDIKNFTRKETISEAGKKRKNS